MGLQRLSLRGRLIACLALVLTVSLAIGTAIALRTATRLVSTELRVALAVGGRAVREGIADLPADPQPALRRLVAGFDGDRHVTARLLDGTGQSVARSALRAPAELVPGWFRHGLAPHLPVLRIAVPGAGTIELAADPNNELAERWSELRDSLLQLGLFCLLAAAAVVWLTERAMRPLRTLAAAFRRLEAGDYTAEAAAPGPPEIGHLVTRFNHMAARLAEAAAHNRRLHLQLLKLQEEERADLARDLHDEIGPFLFAVNMHAATIRQLAETGRTAEVVAQVGAIRDAVGHMQKHVKAILGQLRPLPPAEFGLSPAIEGLVAFWRCRYREIAFAADIAPLDDLLDDAGKEAVYRVVQESLTNAVRHGRPGRIGIEIGRAADGAVRVRVTDDGKGADAGAGTGAGAVGGAGGFGLAGMRERIAALGGRLSIETSPGGGWTVAAQLPATAPAASLVALAP